MHLFGGKHSYLVITKEDTHTGYPSPLMLYSFSFFVKNIVVYHLKQRFLCVYCVIPKLGTFTTKRYFLKLS